MRISDWSSDVCSSDLEATAPYTLEEIDKFYQGGDVQYPNTDWYDLLIRTWSPQQQHNLSVRGGSEKIKYYGTLGYLKQETFFKRSDAGFQRYNLRSKIDATITEGLTARRSAEHTPVLKSLMSISYAVF